MAKGLNTAAAVLTGGMQGFLAAKREQRADEDATYTRKMRDRQMKQWDEQDAERQLTLQGQKVGADIISQDRQRFIDAGGDPNAYRPTTQVLANAMEARGRTFADNGRADLFIKNHAEAMPLYQAARHETLGTALQDFNASTDPDHVKALRLAQAAYPVIRDGRKIVNAMFVPGANGSQLISASLDNGEKVQLNPADVPKRVQWAMMNPEQVSKYEMERMLEGLKTEGKLKEIQARGEEDRKTWGTRGDTAQEVAKIRADATRDAAQTRVDGQITISRLRALGSGGRGLAGGAKGPIVRKTEIQTDGTMIAIMSDGTSRLITDDDGNPRVSAKLVDQALAGTKIVAGSLGGMSNTPQQNAQQGAGLVRGLGAAVTPQKNAAPAGGGKNFNSLWGDR